mgnify:CR=1 FL=1
MATRKVKRLVTGQRAIDGAGVHLMRVLGPDTITDYDPFLMLDSFDSHNPADYIKGFPFHPHRGIETISYLVQGEMSHQDSLGNKGTIHGGESQWMTAGSGIMHQEMPQASKHMLGVQLWLNLPQSEKMTDPTYFDITGEMIGVKETADATVHVLAGEYDGTKGVEPPHIKATIYDVELKEGKTITLPTKVEDNVFVFLIEGNAVIEGQTVAEKTAVLFGEGSEIKVSTETDKVLRFMICAAKPLGEPVAWGGPIVMNTREELDHAFKELDKGTFIKHNAAHI